MKAILTGANGNLGRHIVNCSDFEIIKLNRNDWDDVDSLDVDNIDVFIHCAYDLKKNLNEHPDEIFESNLISTTKALKICSAYKIPRFIFISSCSVYGHSSQTTEDAPCLPVTINGYTKLLNEKIISEFCIANGIDHNILRVFNSYGGNDQFSIIQKVLNAAEGGGRIKLINNGIAQRDYIHVKDTAKVICKLAQSQTDYKIINVGTGTTTKIIDVVTAAENKYEKIEITHAKNLDEVEYSRADISRLMTICNFEFTDVLDYINQLQLSPQSDRL